MRPSLDALDGRNFDVAVIGAGINGTSAAQQLAAAGYRVLLIDKGDFGSGASSRSSRVLHAGLGYLAPERSVWEFVRKPRKLFAGLTMARQAMQARAELVGSLPDRVTPYTCLLPVYRGTHRSWQLAVAFALLKLQGTGNVPLDDKWHDAVAARALPMTRWLRDRDRLAGVMSFREYSIDWPERICVDLALDAERMGAVVRNYTALRAMRKDGSRWQLHLDDALGPQQEATVSADKVLNMTGAWIDGVNALAADSAPPIIHASKGTHIMVRLPPECAQFALNALNRSGGTYTCLPFRGMHAIGPTETSYHGTPDAARPLEEEIAFLIEETNHVLPGLGLKRGDVLLAWAGIRPLGRDPAAPHGRRYRQIHDLAAMGMDGVYAMTAGPVMTHRAAGRDLRDAIGRVMAPTGQPATSRFASGRPMTAAALLDDGSALSAMVRNEQVGNLTDLIFRRLGTGWTPDMGLPDAPALAQAIAPILGWSEAEAASQLDAFRNYLAEHHCFAADD